MLAQITGIINRDHLQEARIVHQIELIGTQAAGRSHLCAHIGHDVHRERPIDRYSLCRGVHPHRHCAWFSQEGR